MSDINQLCIAASVSSGDQLPLWSTGNGQPRRISIQQLQDYLQDALTSDVSGPFKLASYSVAQVPDALSNAGSVIYCSNGNSGAPCLAVSDGVSWKRIALGTAVSAS